ncbi:hypothetical protein [Paraburkholderia fungorum]|uniref:hypothetical protein n=1 Tax=Paraburkholderia fungorum TaxID=134537 RepID=UPI0038B76F31
MRTLVPAYLLDDDDQRAPGWETRMDTLALCCIAAVLLTGCLSTPPEPVVSVPAPICRSEKQCDAMWSAAQDWVSHVTRMQVAQILPDSIVTFPALPNDPTTMRGTVTKRPLEDDSYIISAQFACSDTQLSCARLEQSGVNLFNTMVSAAGEGRN